MVVPVVLLVEQAEVLAVLELLAVVPLAEVPLEVPLEVQLPVDTVASCSANVLVSLAGVSLPEDVLLPLLQDAVLPLVVLPLVELLLAELSPSRLLLVRHKRQI